MATKYRLELDHVHCDRLQDTVGPDELQVIVDGVVLFGGNGGGRIERGQNLSLAGHSQLFFTDVSVQLVEVDAGSNNDDLSTYRVVGATDVNQGLRHRTYTRNNAEYRLAYRVLAA